jgi:solute carrier family 10 (sodium/bile acid cotransporter), member 7
MIYFMFVYIAIRRLKRQRTFMLSRIFPDKFVPVLLLTVLLAALLPVTGRMVPVASGIATAAIVLLFFLHGVRLPRAEVLRAMKDWRLQLSITGFCFGIMPLAGITAHYVFAPHLPPMIALGLIYLAVLPSTVQSATTASSMAGGNVAASVVAAAQVNLLGMFVTPLLFALIAGGVAGNQGGFALSGDMALRIISMLLLPFVTGQILQRWLMAAAVKYRGVTVQLDRTAIAIAVYVALSGAVTAGLWNILSLQDILWLCGALACLLCASFGGAWTLGRVMALPRADGISLFFAGAQKSVAVGAPMAAILFPVDQAGAILLPLIAFHVVQLVMSAWMASVMGAKGS